MLLCIDIGNTHTHYGIVAENGTRFLHALPTHKLEHFPDGLGARLTAIFAENREIEGVAFCSVVPEATEKLLRVFERGPSLLPLFQLTVDKKIGVPISYPRPAEIGQDRLANAAGARLLFGAPTVVIDMGTAVTLDVVTAKNGYEGGIIAPGVEIMRRHLHEQTALLPKLDDSLDVPRAIGQSTLEAMRIGTVIGFAGMVQALLDAILTELANRGEPAPRVLATGGSAALLKKSFRTPFEFVPDITLRGLAAAWYLNR